MLRKKRIGIVTSGGDCPGINAVIRAVAKNAFENDMDVIGIKDGYHGIVLNDYKELRRDDVSGILTVGGTILGTSKKANPYRYAIEKGDKLEFKDLSKQAIRNIEKMGLDCLVCIGGDGSLGLAYRLYKDGVPIVGVPKTIDNDIRGTDITFGFETAVAIASEGIDRVHTTAQSHHRVMIVEVMGHNAGWLALHSGVASGGDIILIPEIPYDMDAIVKRVRERSKRGKRFSIVVVSEGAKPRGGDVVIQRIVKESSDPIRLGGIGFVLGEQIEKITGIETRTVVMGHLQRGGIPVPFDRVLATHLGVNTFKLIKKKMFGHMVGVKKMSFVPVSLKIVAGGIRRVPKDSPLVASAISVGTSFGV